MTVGIQPSDSKRGLTVRLVESATTANGAPSAATDGFALDDLKLGYVPALEIEIQIASDAGSGVMTCSYARVWGYNATTARWFPVGTGSDADKGKLNNAAVLGETGTDAIRHAELFLFPGLFDRIYIELGVFGGAATALDVDVVFPRNNGRR